LDARITIRAAPPMDFQLPSQFFIAGSRSGTNVLTGDPSDHFAVFS
jgi:hypothetical protein